MNEKLNKNRQRRLAIGLLMMAVLAVLSVTALPIWAANASRQAKLAE